MKKKAGGGLASIYNAHASRGWMDAWILFLSFSSAPEEEDEGSVARKSQAVHTAEVRQSAVDVRRNETIWLKHPFPSLPLLGCSARREGTQMAEELQVRMPRTSSSKRPAIAQRSNPCSIAQVASFEMHR